MSWKGRGLSEEQVVEFQDAFKTLDHKNTGMIKTKHLGQLLRRLGQNPTEEELQVRVHCSSDFLKTENVIQIFSLLRTWPSSSTELAKAASNFPNFWT